MTESNRNTVADDAGVPRRTLVEGAAWTVPAVAFAVAAPAHAASAPTPPAPAPRTDIRVSRIAWNAQGGQQDVPPAGPDGRPTFAASNGLYVDTDITNDGPDAVTGLRLVLSMHTAAHEMDPASPLRPRIATGVTPGWSEFTHYTDGGNTVYGFSGPAAVLQPGQTVTVRVLFTTTSQRGVTDESNSPFVAIGALDGATDPTGNNQAQTTNGYDVRT